jgi:hypothetical protein
MPTWRVVFPPLLVDEMHEAQQRRHDRNPDAISQIIPDWVTVRADVLTVEGGCLVFKDGGRVSRAYGVGEWSRVHIEG